MQAVQPWVRIAAILVGAIAAGALLGVLVTAAGRGLAGATPSAAASAIAAATPEQGDSTPSPRQTRQPTPTPEVSSAAPTEVPTATPVESPGVAGCFDIGDEDEGLATGQLVVAEELRDRLPVLGSVFSEPMAYVGSTLTAGSLGLAYLQGFQSCTGAPLTAMRFGWVEGGSTMGVIPMGIEVDGYSGWELAAFFIDGNAYDPNLRGRLRIGEHDGWTYLYSDGIAFTASATTLYLMQEFCCVDVFDEDAVIPTTEEIVNDYLERTNDEPAPMPAR